MSNTTDKQVNITGDDTWQPDQAIVFDQEANQPKQPKLASKSRQTTKAKTNSVLDQNALHNIASRLELLANELRAMIQSSGQPSSVHQSTTKSIDDSDQVIEGYFDGEQMIATNGQAYAVPANYASKSKLVVGDSLKLTIGTRGRFIYKQISPVTRQRLVATLEQAPDGNYYAVHQHQRWRLLKASVSYFRAQPGDRIAILIPEDLPANFAALEHLVAE